MEILKKNMLYFEGWLWNGPIWSCIKQHIEPFHFQPLNFVKLVSLVIFTFPCCGLDARQFYVLCYTEACWTMSHSLFYVHLEIKTIVGAWSFYSLHLLW